MKLTPQKSLGQHFLNSRHVLRRIIKAAEIKEGDNILEIGPGTGVLTRELLKAGANVIAIEKDKRAIELLKLESGRWNVENRKLKVGSGKAQVEKNNVGKLTLIQGDILGLDLDSTFHFAFSTSNFSYFIVANIPYYITGAILEKFLAREPRPMKMILLVQKEVADRIMAKNQKTGGQGKESMLSISVKAFGTPRIIAKVPKGCFTPAPKVDSAILAIENISGDLFNQDQDHKKPEIGHFFEIARAGFAHKRKILKRNLESVMAKEKIEEKWKIMALPDKIRAEDVRLDQWLALSTE